MNNAVAEIKTNPASTLPFDVSPAGSRETAPRTDFREELKRASVPRNRGGKHDVRDGVQEEKISMRLAQGRAETSARSGKLPVGRRAGIASQNRTEKSKDTDTDAPSGNEKPFCDGAGKKIEDGSQVEVSQTKENLNTDSNLAGACAVEAAPLLVQLPEESDATGIGGGEIYNAVETQGEASLPVFQSFDGADQNQVQDVFTQSKSKVDEMGVSLPKGFEFVKPLTGLPVAVSPAQSRVVDASMFESAENSPVDTDKESSVAAIQNLIPNAEAQGDFSSQRVESDQSESPVVAQGEQSPPPLKVSSRRSARVARLSGDGEIPRGISGAQLVATMNNATKQEKFAGQGGQLLPGGALPSVKNGSATSKVPVTEQMFATGTVATAKSLETPADGLAVGDVSRFEPARLERINEIISREVRMFRRTADDQMDVVLTPDAKTQISLRLQWRDGQVEVLARCEMGDHHALSLQWPQLQSSLEQQGVRLSDLAQRASTGYTAFFNSSSFSQPQSNGGQRQAEPPAPVRVPEVPAATPGKATRADLARKSAPTHDRFETWA